MEVPLTLLSLAFVSCGSSKSAKISDVTISGKVNEEITPQTIEIKLSGMEFNAIEANTPVNEWFGDSLPAGLQAKVKEAVAAGDTSLKIEISGKPTAASDKTISITIAKEKVKGADKAVEVKSNSKAKFAITAASSSDTENGGNTGGDSNPSQNTPSATI